MDTDKYDACPKHTQDEYRIRTSDINCSHYRQPKYNKTAKTK